MKRKKSTSNPAGEAFKQHKRGWLALRILAVLFVVTLLAPLWSNDKPLWIRYQGEYFFPLVNRIQRNHIWRRFRYAGGLFGSAYPSQHHFRRQFCPLPANPYDADTLKRF